MSTGSRETEGEGVPEAKRGNFEGGRERQDKTVARKRLYLNRETFASLPLYDTHCAKNRRLSVPAL